MSERSGHDTASAAPTDRDALTAYYKEKRGPVKQGRSVRKWQTATVAGLLVLGIGTANTIIDSFKGDGTSVSVEGNGTDDSTQRTDGVVPAPTGASATTGPNAASSYKCESSSAERIISGGKGTLGSILSITINKQTPSMETTFTAVGFSPSDLTVSNGKTANAVINPDGTVVLTAPDDTKAEDIWGVYATSPTGDQDLCASFSIDPATTDSPGFIADGMLPQQPPR
jgi:hypothetical protein